MIQILNNTSQSVPKLKSFASRIANEIVKQKMKYINIIYLNNEDIRRVNYQYLKHNYPTDIITFNLSESPKILNAELYIGIETVYYNSKIYSTNFKEELKRVIIHGLLHLSGYNDKTREEKTEMIKQENYYMNLVSRETKKNDN